jgi:flagellar biosynthesis/type III secretory pathway chaperone
MKLGALLSEIKGKQSRLARLMDISKETMYVQDGKTPKLDYNEVSKEINELIPEIRHLKLKVQEANLKNKLPDFNMSLAEAIIKVGDLRSLMSYKSSLIKYSKLNLWDIEDKKIDYTPQMEEKELEKEIEELSKEKIKLDNAIQKANWSVEA